MILWDMKVRAAARILEKGVQDDLINQAEDTRRRQGGRSWQDFGLAWATAKAPHYNSCLEEILAAMGENGERAISWDFDRDTHTPQALTPIGDLGTKDTMKVVWDLRIRNELEEEGWTTCYTDGSGLENKASGAFTRKSHTGFHEGKTGSTYLGTRATHYDGELSGIAQALEESREVSMLAILTDSKPAISTIRKLDTGTAPPRSEIEARILRELCRRTEQQDDTGVAWVKGHKGIEGNEEADKLCREASILGHESEGVVTPAGLRAWARRERAKARGGNGEGILGWHRRAISAYTWCVTGKGPQKKWLHHIRKTDSPTCGCGPLDQSGEHLVEECRLLAEGRRLVEQEDLCAWKSRHVHKREKKKEKGPVGPEKEEEEEKLETFFCKIYDFHNPVPVAPVYVPEEILPRYAISFVPASVPVFVPVPTSVPVPASVPAPVSVSALDSLVNFDAPSSPVSTGYSVISSVNFVVPSSPVSTSPCIGTTQ